MCTELAKNYLAYIFVKASLLATSANASPKSFITQASKIKEQDFKHFHNGADFAFFTFQSHHAQLILSLVEKPCSAFSQPLKQLLLRIPIFSVTNRFWARNFFS